jgi:flagellar biosynthetic protein FliR
MSVPVRIRLTIGAAAHLRAVSAAPPGLCDRPAPARPGHHRARPGIADRRGARPTARLTISALQVAGSVIAQQLGLGFAPRSIRRKDSRASIVGNFPTLLGITLIFATDLHHMVIAALHDSYRLFRPGEVPIVSDVTMLVTNIVASAFRVGIQLSGPFLVFGLVFNIALGVLSRLMPQMQVYFVAVPLSIMIGFLILIVVVGAMMGSFLGYVGGVLRELAPYST